MNTTLQKGEEVIRSLSRLKLLILIIVVSDIFTGSFALATGLYTGYEQSQKLITLIPGMISRGMLFLFVIRYLCFSYKHITAVYIVAAIPIFTELYVLLKYSNGLSSLILGFIYSYKMICIYSLYVFAFKYKDKVSTIEIVDAFILAFFLYTLSVLIGHLTGYEYTTYGGKGSSGLLIKGSANSVSMVFVAMYALVLTRLKSKVLVLIISVYTLSVALILMTKVSFFGALIITSFWMYYNTKNKVLFCIVVMSLLGVSGGSLLSYVMNSNLYDRMLFVYENYSLVGLILSGRDSHLTIGWEIYSSGSWMELLFGFGYDNFRMLMGTYFGEPIGIEIDFFDLLFKNGILFTMLYVSPIIYVVCKSIKKKNASNNYKIIRLSYIVLIVISCISGHVLMSGLNGYVLPMLSIILIGNKYESANDI